MAELNENPFATHLPVLIGMSRLLQINRIIEFGCGRYSTLTFLDRSVFPDIETLHTYENDPAWINQIAELVRQDARVRFEFVNGSMSTSINNIQFENYDLIFIDDSLTSEDRAKTIRQVSQNCHSSNVVIIHDYEVRLYREASKIFPNRFTFTALNPNTGIVWSEAPLKKSLLRKLDAVIARHSKRIKSDDLHGWKNIMDKHL